MVGFRDADVIEDVLVVAEAAAEAAEIIRSERPGALIAAVIRHPEPSRWWDVIDYSDLPLTYQALRRFNAGRDDLFGYLVVSVGSDGSHSSFPNRPVSRQQAEGHRDWMLRGYFENRHQHRRRPHLWKTPNRPVVVSLVPVESSTRTD